MNIKITELIGILGFTLALLTFILTRIERRKQLTIDLFCDSLRNIDKNNEDNNTHEEDRVIVIHLINTGQRPIVINKESIKLFLGNIPIRHGINWIGKENYSNPINPGEDYKFAVFLDAVLHLANITNKNKGIHLISATLEDIQNCQFKTKSKYELLLEVDEIRKKHNKSLHGIGGKLPRLPVSFGVSGRQE